MWINGNQNKKGEKDFNEHIKAVISGEMTDKEARLSLVQFLHHNLGLTVELLMGFKLFPYQEIILRGWFKKNYNLGVWARGSAKSFTAAIFCCLYPIFYPNTRIVVVSSNFRTSRRIFEQVQKFVSDPKAILLRQCFKEKTPERRNDAWQWSINGGSLTCLPLSGDKIRGVRADVLIVDEFLLVPEEVYKSVLMPFLVAKGNVQEQLKVRSLEDKLIKRGLMKEEDRFEFDTDKKIIALSSASFQFEFLYKMYQEWIDKIVNPQDEQKASYFVSQFAYNSMPEELIDASIVEEAKSGGEENSVFLREYGARFTDDSDSYFSAKKMAACTIKDTEGQTIEIVGESKDEYVLAVDPSFSSSKLSDDFAMCLVKLHPEKQSGTLVHNYAVAGGDLKQHLKYAHYLFRQFNIVYVICDNAGGPQFIESCNSSLLFKGDKIELKGFNSSFDLSDWEKSVQTAKFDYNLSSKKIVHYQTFSPQFIRAMNEWLQASLDYKRIWFASKAMANDVVYQGFLKIELPEDVIDIKYSNKDLGTSIGGKTYHEKLTDFIDLQEFFINLTKKECSLIEVKISPSTGVQSFDLPQYLKRSKDLDKPRRDSYTTLLLANWGLKCLFAMRENKEEVQPSFIPFGV